MPVSFVEVESVHSRVQLKVSFSLVSFSSDLDSPPDQLRNHKMYRTIVHVQKIKEAGDKAQINYVGGSL